MNFRNYYRRPRETHRCGLSAAGRSCVHGPNGRQCGQSRDIPERCTPVRTLLGWSRLTSSICTLAAIGTLCYWFAISKNNVPIAPGHLSKAHAQLLVSGVSDHPLSIDDEKRCAACHPNAIPKSTGSLASTNPIQASPVVLGAARKQSELCMNCHYGTMPNGLLGNPHDLAGEDLKALFASVSEGYPTKLSQEPTECSQCHREHQGAEGDLQAISSAKCQACHRNQFESFAQGHPEFESYPPSKPRSIGFDHARHAELHFAKKGKTFDCSVCHLQSQQSGLVGSVFRSVSFEQSCAECHNESLKSSGIEGLVVFQIPSLDRNKLARNGHDIGPWPESASLIMDGQLSPLLHHLLRTSESGQKILSRLPKSGQLRDINPDDPTQAAAAVELAKFVRETWGQLASNGQPILKRWFETSSTVSPNPISTYVSPKLELHARFVAAQSQHELPSVGPESTTANPSVNKQQWMSQLSMGVPPDLLRSASSKWFREEPKPPLATATPPVVERLPLVMNVDPSNATPANVISQPKSTSSVQRQNPNLTTPANPISIRLSPTANPHTSQDGDDLLSDAQDDLLGPPTNNDPAMNGNDDLLSDESDLLAGPNRDALSAADGTQSSTLSSNKPLKPWEHLPYGGWMIDENRVALVYVPTGHADPWVARWIEWNLLVQNDAEKLEFQDGFLKQCVQCHSFDSQRVRQMLNESHEFLNKNSPTRNAIPVSHTSARDINEYCWKIEQRPNALRELTKFNHTPHLSINVLRDCQSCHTMKKLNESQIAEQGWSDRGRTTRNEFQPIQKDKCASCHTNRSAGDACTQCHNYHVDGIFHGQ